MNVQSTPTSRRFDLVTAARRVYAAKQFERLFDIGGSEQTNAVQIQADPTPLLLTVQSRRGAACPVPRKDLLAVKTAQLVAEHLADEAHSEMSRLGREFNLNACVRRFLRSTATLMAPTLQPLSLTQRRTVAARVVNPRDNGEELDAVLDGIGRGLDAYCHFLPTVAWTHLPNDTFGTQDARVVGWRDRDGRAVVDLLDTLGPDRTVHDHAEEVAHVLAVARKQFGTNLTAVRWLPTYAMRQARRYRPDGSWEPYPQDSAPPVVSVA